MVDQWVDIRSEEELDQQIVKNEIKKMENKLARYNVPPVGYMEEEKKEGRCRITQQYFQKHSAASKDGQSAQIE